MKKVKVKVTRDIFPSFIDDKNIRYLEKVVELQEELEKVKRIENE